MAVASMAMPGSTAGPTLGFDDYSLYSNLSDDELMQLAIERSLSETHDATAPGEASNTTTALGRRTGQYRANPPPTRLNPPNPPRQESSHRPPTAKPTDAIVSLLIKATSKSRVNRSGISPLHLAAECNRDEVLEVLIEAGYDVNAMLSEDRSKMYEDHRSTILYFAVANGNVEATTMLLEAGANPNLDTFNTLLVAVRQGSIELVTLLVEHGANVNAYVLTHPTSFPATVMFSMKYLSMLKYLMDNGCDAHSCFSCTYGSGPHPPIQETSERDDLRYNNDTRRNTGKAVQFCEIISTQAINRWAGPIIDILLDYVGHVKLCSRLTEHLDSFGDWEAIKEKATPPRPLMQLCRLKIRQQVGLHRLRCINKLPLPPRVIKYLNHEERNQEEFCAF